MQQKIQQFVFLSERLLSEAGELRVRKTWNELSSVSVQLAPYMQQLSQSFDPKYALLFLLSCGNDGTQKNGCFSMLFRKILTRIPNNDFLKLLASVNRVELNTYLLPFLYEKDDIGSVAAYTSAKLGLKVKYDSFEFFLSSRDWTQQDLINLGFLVLNDEKEALIQRLGYIYNSNPREVYLQFLNVLQASNIIEPVIPEINEVQQVQQSPTPQRINKPVSQNKFQLPQSNSNYKYKLTSNKPTTDSNTNSFAGAGVSPIPSSVSNNTNNNEVPVANQNSLNNQNVTQNFNSAPVVENRQVSSPAIHNNNNNFNKSTSVQQKEDAPIRYVAEKEDSTTNEEVPQRNTSKSSFNKAIKTTNNKVNTSSNTSSFGDKFNSILSDLKERFSSLESSAQSGLFKNKPVLISIVIVLIIFLYLITKLFGAEDQSQIAIKPPPKVDKVPEYWINAVTNKKITPQYIRADVDYRMGELYLSRNLYDEAITFFQSAIKTDSSHNVARLRWGYAELQQGNYFVSEKLLKETLKYEPKMQNANLYLARNYFGEKKYPEAGKYYKIEYKNYNNLDVGMEYANFLAKIDKQDEAMDFLSILQESHPDKMLILDSINNKEKSDNKKQKGKK